MKLYIKQRLFTWGDKFDVKDEEGASKYFIEGEVLSIPPRLHIYNESHEQVAMVARKLLTLTHAFEIYKDGVKTATIQKIIRLIHPEYAVDGKGWTVKGNFSAHDYKVTTREGDVIASIHKVWMSWGDSFEIEYDDPSIETELLAIVIAIDTALDDNVNAAHA